ncbi:MAG: DNA-binding protein [Defluviitaleaceae bacterium]|nr:DNA-binding protein [Defluviitaleaceae bacterium]
MEDRVKQIKLYDMYGKLLTEKKKEIFELYYHEDLSMAEIAEKQKITAQAVQDHLKKTSESLEDYEEKLGFLKKNEKIKKLLEEISKELEL